LLFVRQADSPLMASKGSGIYNARFGTSEVYTRTTANHGNFIYYAGGWRPWGDISA